MSARGNSEKGGRPHRKAGEVPASRAEVVRPERPVPGCTETLPLPLLIPRSQRWRQRRLKGQMGKWRDL